jgi:hypothetical protein
MRIRECTVQGIVSAKKEVPRPQRLMQRLALAANGETASGSDDEEDDGRTGRHWNAAACFGLGVLASGAIGVVALLGLVQLAPDRLAVLDDLTRRAAVVLAPWPAISPPPPPAVREAAPAYAFEVLVSRAERASAPFGLRLTGADDAQVEVLLRNVPPTALLSRGERRDERTWAVKPSDLAALHLSLSDGTPDVFEMRIDIVAPADVAAASTVARVRLADDPGNARSSPAPELAAAAASSGRPSVTATVVDRPSQARSAAAAGRSSAAREEKAARTPAPQRALAAPAETVASGPQAPQQARHWPEGASGLGAVSRESERQVWWKMPPPSWSPFQEAGR